ncbi:hypothetical protein [Curvivirga sp.]|uniref:hypothetical protein n=1 Tax=Curvivirga sp. TaxID=2856848 RepID=UPI003B59AE5D
MALRWSSSELEPECLSEVDDEVIEAFSDLLDYMMEKKPDIAISSSFFEHVKLKHKYDNYVTAALQHAKKNVLFATNFYRNACDPSSPFPLTCAAPYKWLRLMLILIYRFATHLRSVK